MINKIIKNKDKFLIILIIGIILFLFYLLYTKSEKFTDSTLIGSGFIHRRFYNDNGNYCYFNGSSWIGANENPLKFNYYSNGTLLPIPDENPNSCYQQDIKNNFKYSFNGGSFNYGNYGMGLAEFIRDPTTTLAPTATPAPTTTLAPTTTPASTTTQAPTTTRASTTTLAPTTTPFITTPYNTQYLNAIKTQIDNGYSMLNNNRFTIMDNQLKLDNLNMRVNTLLNNINKINNISESEIQRQQNNLLFY